MIHAVGPVWRGGHAGEADVLASCYRRALELAQKRRLRSIALPCIRTGVYGFPIEPAASVAIRIVRGELPRCDAIEPVVFCCFSQSDPRVCQALL